MPQPIALATASVERPQSPPLPGLQPEPAGEGRSFPSMLAAAGRARPKAPERGEHDTPPATRKGRPAVDEPKTEAPAPEIATPPEERDGGSPQAEPFRQPPPDERVAIERPEREGVPAPVAAEGALPAIPEQPAITAAPDAPSLAAPITDAISDSLAAGPLLQGPPAPPVPGVDPALSQIHQGQAPAGTAMPSAAFIPPSASVLPADAPAMPGVMPRVMPDVMIGAPAADAAAGRQAVATPRAFKPGAAISGDSVPVASAANAATADPLPVATGGPAAPVPPGSPSLDQVPTPAIAQAAAETAGDSNAPLPVSTFDSEIASDVAMATPPATDGAGAQAALDTSRHRRRLGAEAIDGARLHVTVNTPAARSPVVATPVPDEAAAAEAASPGGSASTIALASSTAAIGTSKGAGTSIAGATKPAVDTTATASAVSAHDSPVPATPMTQDQGSAALAPANASPGAATAMGAGDGGGLAAAPLASGNSGQLPTAEPLPVPGRPAVVSQVPLQDVSVQITRAAKAGLDRIEIELRPDTLGRIDVRLDLGRDGRVNALILADNRETLGLLAADARGLSQVLQDAGLKADAGSLQFSLRGEHGSGGHGPGNQGSAPWAPPRTTGSEATPERGAQYGDGPAAGRPRARGRVDVIA